MIGEREIAEGMAAHLHMLSNWSEYCDRALEHGYTEEKAYLCLQQEKIDLTIHKAAASGRDLITVWKEVELGVMTHLARILAATIDPNVASLTDSTVSQAGEVCAVCQDEMRVGSVSQGLGCSHTFHPRCIERWVKSHNSCPVCRHSMEIQDFGFPTSEDDAENLPPVENRIPHQLD